MVHRDLKHDNILVEIDAEHEDGSEFIVCKLTDFGMAFEDDKQQNHNEICGTDTFMAPEVVRGQNQDTKVDIWSLGVLTFIMLTNTAPFHGAGQRLRDNI